MGMWLGTVLSRNTNLGLITIRMFFKVKRLAGITSSGKAEKKKMAVSTGALQRCGKWREEGRSTNE